MITQLANRTLITSQFIFEFSEEGKTWFSGRLTYVEKHTLWPYADDAGGCWKFIKFPQKEVDLSK